MPLFEAICQTYDLGECLSPPLLCSGGLSHLVSELETTRGHYIVKHLNPAIINNPQIAERYRVTETIAQALQKYISAICAIKNNNDVLFIFAEHTIMLFPYVQAKILKQNKLTLHHVEKIAESLADIHLANIKIEDAPPAELRPVKQNCETKKSLHAIVEGKLRQAEAIITDIENKNQQAQSILANNLVISHRDYDPKNVLWDHNHQYYIIDWEAAGLINKTKDLVATALYWSMDNQHIVNPQYLAKFILTYQKKSCFIDVNELEAGFYGLLGDWLGWLEFNLSRLANSPIGSANHQLGKKEALKTIKALISLSKQFPDIIAVVTKNIRVPG